MNSALDKERAAPEGSCVENRGSGDSQGWSIDTRLTSTTAARALSSAINPPQQSSVNAVLAWLVPCFCFGPKLPTSTESSRFSITMATRQKGDSHEKRLELRSQVTHAILVNPP